MVEYVNASYKSDPTIAKSDPTIAKSQLDYVFLWYGASISSKSVKQTIITTSSNHVEIIALYETPWECI